MRNRFIHFPDAPLPASGGGNGLPGVPRADADLLETAEAVDTKWTASTFITLQWTTASIYKQNVALYRTALGQKKAVAANRPSQTATLANANERIEEGVSGIKLDIKKKFKKDAVAQYTRYGIVKEGNNYVLPTDNDERKLALPLMAAAVNADGFGDGEYGSAFWTEIIADFGKALKATKDTDALVSGKTIPKNELKAYIVKVHKALRKVLEGNYPDSYKQVFREWGWMKEKY